MSSTEEYLRTLTNDELVAVAMAFCRQMEDESLPYSIGDDCPYSATDYCPMEENGTECGDDIALCWCRYFVMQYRNQKQEETEK